MKLLKTVNLGDKRAIAFLVIAFSCTVIAGQVTLPNFIDGSMVRGYPAASFSDLTHNCLKDMPSRELDPDELKLLNQVLLHSSRSSRWRALQSITNHEGLFVEADENGDIDGFYISRKGLAVIAPWGFVELRSFPQSICAKYDSLFLHFKPIMPSRRINDYSGHLMLSHVKSASLSSLSFKKHIKITFYVKVDSAKVQPISYDVVRRAKGGIKVNHRWIPVRSYYLFDRLDENNNLVFHSIWNNSGFISKATLSHDSISERELSKWIPLWSQMTDQERMRTLDDILEKSLIQ